MILVNSNPATIMTDPDFADRTYVEPLDAGIVAKVIEAERPDALLPTLGGQTALNLAIELAETGVLERFGVEMIGARLEAIKKAEDRDRFKEAMGRVGLDLPRSGYARSLEEAMAVRRELASLPLIIRPSRTLGGSGANIAYTEEGFVEMAGWGLRMSPVHEILVEESILGWKEFELEVMRDHKDNVVIVCPIENFDPMGVHTGDSITVAPAQTLTDKEYQVMRDAALHIIREIGVDTGGSNIQFAVHPDNGRLVVIEMNPRVSRSSALASKATGFPIAKIAAKLAVGYTLDEIPNDVTRETPRVFRAHHRLRGGEGAAVYLREVPPDPRRADHPDEVGGGGHVHRPHLQGGAAEGHALVGDQQLRFRGAGVGGGRRRTGGAAGGAAPVAPLGPAVDPGRGPPCRVYGSPFV